MKVVKFLIKLVFIILVLAVAVKAGLFCYDGYNMYKAALEEESLDDRIEAVMSSDSYAVTESISEDFLTAVVCIEDRDFYKHKGYNLKSMGRAVIKNFKEKSLGEGGSTITQQTVKNLCFSGEKSFSRKIAELLMAVELEKTISKDEILELYVNIIYFGDGYTGIRDACMGYFGKKPYELTFYESTLLAGLPQAPSAYALSTHRDRAEARQKEVIQAMIDCLKITPSDAQARLNEQY